MSRRSALYRFALAFAFTFFMAMAAQPSSVKAERYLVELTGGTLANFSMTCFAENNGRQTRIRRRGYLPQSYIIHAQSLHCTIALLESHDRLHVRLLDSKKRVIAEMEQHAIFPRITIRSAGSWGPSGASRGAAPFSQNDP